MSLHTSASSGSSGEDGYGGKDAHDSFAGIQRLSARFANWISQGTSNAVHSRTSGGAPGTNSVHHADSGDCGKSGGSRSAASAVVIPGAAMSLEKQILHLVRLELNRHPAQLSSAVSILERAVAEAIPVDAELFGEVLKACAGSVDADDTLPDPAAAVRCFAAMAVAGVTPEALSLIHI